MISLHAETEKKVKQWAKQMDIKSLPDALSKLVDTAISRKAALSKYAAKQRKGPKKGPHRSKRGGVKKGKAKSA